MSNHTIPTEVDSVTEEWRAIPGWEGYYEASSIGRVRGVDRVVTTKIGREMSLRGIILKQRIGTRGYPMTMMSRENNYAPQLVHRLVLSAFAGEAPDGMECCHADGDRTNNRIENLRWGTHSENSVDQVNHGTHRNIRKTHCVRVHEFTEENTYIRPGGQRNCRVCKKMYDEEVKMRRHQLKAA